MGVFVVGLLWAAPEKGVQVRKLPYNLPVMGTANDPEITVPVIPPRPSREHFDDYVGTIDTAGTTYYDYQHNGTSGKMIAVDDLGMVSVVWMNGLYPDMNRSRYVYYNVWDPTSSNFLFDPDGIRIDASQRAGYISQTTNADGFCFPAFHQITIDPDPHAAAAGDYAAYSDAYTTIEPAWCYEGGADIAIIWPKIDMDINGVLHMVSTESPASGQPGDPQRVYYSRGIPEFDQDGFFLDIHWDQMTCGGFDFVDSVMVIAPDIACSRHSQRVAIAWSHSMDDLTANPSQYNNEIYMQVSDDGGLNWGDPINVTQWADRDPECWYYTNPGDITCNRDTLRVYTDCSILLDENDYVHIAFTVAGFWWYLPDQTDTGWISIAQSMTYHWSEETHFFSLIGNGWYPAYDPGAWQRSLQRPNLAIDPTNGYLYCSYMRYDTLTYTENGFPIADAWVTVSTNNGCSWAAATNVTNTEGENPPIPMPTGESMHERDITVAKLVTDGFLHMEYILDKDAGGIPQSEGVATLNPVIYQRIPVSQIATSPLIEEYPMHWDSVGFPRCTGDALTNAQKTPEQFLLYPNYPNPFNPTTMLQFDLAKATKVTLKVYNVLGQEVASLFDDASLSAGVHRVEFDGSNLASGVYIYSLVSNGYAASKKMVLMK
ncbi:MAG: T9SS type A sorting domain-containing protein [Calditrichaeota bacterium]|nr:T9SS type A sorting domain-containing protein [Calditrichota bacterium]